MNDSVSTSQPVKNSDMFGSTEQLRTRISIAVMQSLLSNPDITARYECVLSDAAHDAVVAADYLIAQLDKTKER